MGDRVDFLESDTDELFATAKVIEVIEKLFCNFKEEDRKGHEKFKNDKEMYKTYEKYYNKKVGPETAVKIIFFKLLR